MDAIDRDVFMMMLKNLYSKGKLTKEILHDFVDSERFKGSILRITAEEYEIITQEKF